MLQLIQIGIQMLHTDLVVSTNNRAFKKAPDAFDAVGVNIAANPLFRAVADALMPRVFISDAKVSGKFIGVDGFGLRIGVISNELVKRSPVSMTNNLQPNLAFTLNRSDGNRLVSFIASTHAARLAADIGFVNLYNAFKKLAVHIAHCCADTVTKIPCCLISHAKCAFHLQRTNAFFAFSHEVNSDEPLAKRQMAIVEDRAGSGRKPITASIAVVLLAFLKRGNALALTARANNARRPAQLGKAHPAFIL